MIHLTWVFLPSAEFEVVWSHIVFKWAFLKEAKINRLRDHNIPRQHGPSTSLSLLLYILPEKNIRNYAKFALKSMFGNEKRFVTCRVFFYHRHLECCMRAK